MALKESMDILIKDMKIQDARIEADIQTCASLLGNVEKHTKELKRRQEEKEMFEQLLYRIGGERDFFKDSVQIRTLEDLALEQEQEIADNNHLIEAQQAYYDALRKKDYQALWRQDEDRSAMAAICFAVEQWRDTSEALVRKLLRTRNELPEDVARYLLEKILVYSESKREADETAEEADRLLRDFIEEIMPPQSDEVWRNINVCLNIRKTQRTGVRCKKVLNHYQDHKSRFETFEEDYADNCREISAEIKRLEDQRIGKSVDDAVKSTKEWFTNRTAQLDSLIKRRRSEAALIEDHLQMLQSMYAELENGMESGLQPMSCDVIYNTVSSMESEAAGFVDTGELDRERKQLLEEYQTHLKEIRAAKDAEVERAASKQRERVRTKADRAKKFRKALPLVGIIFGITFGIIFGIIFVIEALDEEKLYTGLSYYLPNVYFGMPGEVINDSPSPYFITLVPKTHIEINSGKDLSFVIDPFGAEYVSITPPVRKIKIHEGTKKIDLNCEQLKELTIPDSVTSLELSYLTDELALTLDLPEHLESFRIVNSPYLTDTGFQALEIQESVQEINVVNCCNLDMSEVYDDLYCTAIEGAPLLENEVQLKNLLDQREIPYGAAVTEEFDPKLDILTSAKFGEETTPDENTRRVDFSFDVKHNSVIYTFDASVVSSMVTRSNDYNTWEVPQLDVWMECTNVNPSELLQQLRAGDRNAILEILDGWTISPLDGPNVILYKNDITIEESALIEESTEKYYIPLKLKIKKRFSDVTFLGSVLLSEQNAFIPRLITSKAVSAEDADDWSIYDDSGNVKEELVVFQEELLVSQNIPEDAFTWNGSSYYLYHNFETWEEAEAYCESLGGHLAIITSDEENEALYSYVTGQGYRDAFFGASDAAEEGEWRWVDGSAMSYTNWHSGEPNSESKAEDYAMYYSKFKDGTWNDGPFGGVNTMFICEWD